MTDNITLHTYQQVNFEILKYIDIGYRKILKRKNKKKKRLNII